ncbi:MAG: hypothetical protein HFG41_12290 [Coprococcus sp.]|nr:hypothetical protein [Coprococcus sp.]
MKIMRKYGKIMGMSAAALALTAVLSAESSMAYFTTYVSAGGSQTVNLRTETEIHEDVSKMTKHIGITNTSPENDCFVRVKVFYVDDDKITIECKPAKPVEEGLEEEWYEDKSNDPVLGGYWYYRPLLEAGKTTSILDAKINVPESKEEFDKDKFNVVVIYEFTPAIYDEDGNVTYDWSKKLDLEYENVPAVQGEGEETE